MISNIIRLSISAKGGDILKSFLVLFYLLVGTVTYAADFGYHVSRDAFTPYAALGQSNNDGLAPNESNNALAIACMNAAGYPNSANAPFAVSIGPAAWRSRSPVGGNGATWESPKRSSTASGFPPAPP